jgi:AbrB family looped-hinge helix DNA binding protein
MRTTIDSAGRIVVPKVLRDELGLSAGSSVEISSRDGKLEIEPAATKMRLVKRGKGLVAATDEPLPELSAEDVRAVIESLRR